MKDSSEEDRLIREQSDVMPTGRDSSQSAGSRLGHRAFTFLGRTVNRLLIGGEWHEPTAGRSITSINPATGEPLAEIADADGTDVDRAVAAARRAFEGPWRRFRPYDRQLLILQLAELIDQNFEELATLDSLDMGMPITRALSLRQRTLGRLRYYAGQALTIQGETIENSLPADYVTYTVKEPIGVVGSIIPWNGPLGAAVWKIGPVLATGCTMVLKPAEESSLSAIRLGELILEAGIPAGVINLITGRGEVAGARLAAHPDIDMIAFTGSTATGQSIIRASAGNVKRLSLELGGKSPDIVFADADLEAAAIGAATAAFNNSGQICFAGTRLFVQDHIYEEFVEAVAQVGAHLRLGDPRDSETELGPLVSRQQLDRVLGYLDAGKAAGAMALSGGARLEGEAFSHGYYVPPTVLTAVTDDMVIAREEIFGPVLCAMRFSDIDDVLKKANSTLFGLGSGVWTRDITQAHRIARSIRAGTVWINCYGNSDPAVPQGGFKMSGYGREGGVHHVDEYLGAKSVWIKA